MGVEIAEHAYKHGLTAKDIEYAWSHCLRRRHRGAPHEGEVVVIGCDEIGRLVEVVAVERVCGTLIYHALRPPTRKVLKELGFRGLR